MRILFPMWFLGCYQFTWHMLYETNPTLAYLNLLNPVTYIVEGMRGSLDLNLPLLSYPVCVAATSIFIILFAWAGVRNFKRRLDCL
jgi:ABC-2 type transport system permease protein